MRSRRRAPSPRAPSTSWPVTLTPPRAAWVMTPAGEVTERTIAAVCGALSPGDIVIDGGNANYKDSMRRAATLKTQGIHFLDAGTSGGIWGLTEGYSLMVGGEKEAFDHVEPIFQTLAPGTGPGLRSRRARRRGALHQDGPQRHRVRHDAGLRRGL